MSEFRNESKPKPKPQPSSAAGDDPWAKWRKAESVTVDLPAVPVAPVVSVAPARAASRPEAAAEPVVRERPSGTLRVNRATAAPEKPAAKKPFKKQSTAATARPVVSPWAKVAVQATARAALQDAVPMVKAPSPDGVRLSKVMSERAMCSRREADLWIERGWVFVDGERIAELGSRINPEAEITISKEAQYDQAKQVTILLNKPVGYVSSQPEPGCTPAVTLIKAETQFKQPGTPQFKPWMLRGLAPAGRLDIDSTGLLVLTQDGRVAKKLIGEDSQAEKEYLVRVSGEMVKGGLRLLQFGLELDGKPLKQAWVKQLNEDQLHFILREGKKRQIRRMCELVGLTVIGLKRVRIGKVKLGDLALGEWRFLRSDESF